MTPARRKRRWKSCATFLRDLYRARSLLRRRVVSRKLVPAVPLRVKKRGVRLDTVADDVASAASLPFIAQDLNLGCQVGSV